MSWPRDKKTSEMQYSWGGGRSRCGRHPAMNPNEVQLLTLTPGSLLSNPHLPLSHPSLPSSSSCPSVSQPPHPFALWLPLWPPLPLPPPPKPFLSPSLFLPSPPFCFYAVTLYPFILIFSLRGIKKKKKKKLSVLESHFYHSPLSYSLSLLHLLSHSVLLFLFPRSLWCSLCLSKSKFKCISTWHVSLISRFFFFCLFLVHAAFSFCPDLPDKISEFLLQQYTNIGKDGKKTTQAYMSGLTDC